MFRRFVERQLARVRQCPQAGMLGDRVYERLEDTLKRKVELIAGSTTTHMISQAVADNPFAAAFPDLITDIEPALNEVVMIKYGTLALQGEVNELRNTFGKSLNDIFKEVFAGC